MIQTMTASGDDDARWGLTRLQQLVDQSPYVPLDDPAEAVAERLMMLAHLTFNADVWGADRRSRYWGAFTDAAAGAVLSACLVEWWSKFVSTMGGVPLGDIALVDEKNRLLRPRLLTPPVEDSQVLRVMDTHAADLVDRTRVWVHNRRLAAQERQTRLQLGPVFDGLEEQ